MTTLVRMANYRYYSMYPTFVPPGNCARWSVVRLTRLVATINFQRCERRVIQKKNFLPENTSLECIPKAGVFIFSFRSLNYTQARSFCRERNASLAHIISEVRTDGLGKFVSPNSPSFVGLSSNDKERIWKNEYGTRVSIEFYSRQACRVIFVAKYFFNLSWHSTVWQTNR